MFGCAVEAIKPSKRTSILKLCFNFWTCANDSFISFVKNSHGKKVFNITFTKNKNKKKIQHRKKKGTKKKFAVFFLPEQHQPPTIQQTEQRRQIENKLTMVQQNKYIKLNILNKLSK